MKLLQLTYESLGSPFGFGGAGVRAYEIYKRLKDRHDITMLCLKYPGVKDREMEGLQHIFVGTESMSRTRSVLAYTLKAAGFVKKYGDSFDVIIENFLPAIPYFSRFLTNTPVILQMQGIMGVHSLKKFNPLYGLPMFVVEKIYPHLYKTFILVGNENGYSTGEQSSQKTITKGKKYAVIPNGINEELLSINSEEENDYILFLSRIDVYTKGLDILIDAFRNISERFNNVKLFFAGYEFNSTADLFQNLPGALRDRVKYVGFVSGQEKLELLSRARIFVLPSRHEAHPVSVLEALALGKAVLVSDIPALQYVGDQELGLTFKSGSSQDLAEKLSILLGNGTMRQHLGKRGRDFASQFLWDDMALNFERFIVEVAAKK
ncbi:glycosyltransferase family 1 protein [bacterium]|nr:MAG: glycosyltransferase family 1 protein [bacterium]